MLNTSRRRALYRIPDDKIRGLVTKRPAWHTPGYEVLNGVIDMHVHPEACDEIAFALQATEAGMKALIFKSEMAPSVFHSRLTKEAIMPYSKEKQRSPVSVYGGVVLDKGVCGGLNTAAVRKLLKAYPDEMKVVWMPVNDAAFNLEVGGLSRSAAREKGIYILDGGGKILAEVEEIVNLAAENNLIISCGHLSIEESLALIDIGKSAGVKSMLVEHPCLEVPCASLDEQKQIANKGGFLNHAALEFDLFHNAVPPSEIAQSINVVGPEHCTLCTDVGLPFMWNPVEAMRILIWYLKALGITDKEIETMARKNPSQILGI